MVWATICGVLPIVRRGFFGPYPDALYSVEAGKLLLDYSIEQLATAGVTQIYVPIATRDLEWFSRFIGYQRQGLEIIYVEITPKETASFYHYVVRACRQASRAGDYTRYFILDPCVRVANPNWVLELVSSCPAPHHLGITDCFYLDEGTLGKVRSALREGEGETCLAQILGSRYLDPPDHLDLADWSGVKAWHRR